ncbi:MAG: flagellar basal body rod protein FlgB [Lachnospiraceae bacterium]|nr:flagellar basal body rod protein FlgB [Lachnospiraceae bacterium]
MINTGVYNYIDVLDKAADASWIRNEVINNNISNNDTPGFKRQDVQFDDILAREIRSVQYRDLDDAVAGVNLNRVTGRVYTDSVSFSYRIDGNNVDMDTENVELASNQIKYNALIESVSQEFARLKSVIK